MTTSSDNLLSVTIGTDDLAVMYCLGALVRYGKRRKEQPEARVKDDIQVYGPDVYRIAFHFSTSGARDLFLTKARAILPPNAWRITEGGEGEVRPSPA